MSNIVIEQADRSLDILLGEETRIRRFAASDISPEYIGWLNNPLVARYSNQRFIQHTVDSSVSYVRSFERSSNLLFALCDVRTESIFGTATVFRNENHGTADVGILIGDPGKWGKGLGLDAFQTIVAALERSGTRKITGGTMSLNVGMVKIFLKSGLSFECSRPGQELFDGLPVDLVYYAKFCNA